MQNHVHFPAFMELSKDQSHLTVTNRKPVDHTEYIMEADIYKL